MPPAKTSNSRSVAPKGTSNTPAWLRDRTGKTVWFRWNARCPSQRRTFRPA
jgi:hypothetical protein